MKHKVPDHVCPWCKAVHDGVTATTPGADEALPRRGDIALCIGCGEWSVYDSFWVGGMRKPNHAEYVEIVDNPLCGKMRAAWLMVQEDLGHELETRSQSHRKR